MTEVVAALIWDAKNERFMICRRPEHKARGLLWEFVGGKVEAGESDKAALIRECREELALDVVNTCIRTSVVHEYDDRTIRLTLIDCEPAPGAEPAALEHSELGWFAAEEMDALDFCAADRELLPVVLGGSRGGAGP